MKSKRSAEKRREINAKMTQERRERDREVLAEVGLYSAEGLLGKIHKMNKEQRTRLRDLLAKV